MMSFPGPEKLAHRGSHGASLETPRAGRWKNGGLAELPTPDASMLRDVEARGSSGTPASRASLTLEMAQLGRKAAPGASNPGGAALANCHSGAPAKPANPESSNHER